MKPAVSAPADKQVLSDYREYNSRVLVRGLMVGNALSVVGMPGGFVLDYFLSPDHFVEFLLIRLGVAGILLGIIGLLYLERNRPNLTRTKILGVVSALIMNFAFCWMIFQTDGAKSPYYAGLNLIITCWSVLLPWTVVETAVMCLISLVGYVVACLANPSFFEAASYPLFAYSLFFILITTAVCLAITFFLARARFQDFGLRHQLDIQNRELQDVDRLKTQFFSNVSHELRTPLTLILGPVESLLSRAAELDARDHEDLLLIQRNALRLLKLINDLLDLTRLDQGRETLRRQAVPAGMFLRGLVDSVRHLGLSKQLRFKLEEGDPALQMVADPARMEKVVVNLLTNAIKFTPVGGTITLRWRDEEGGLVVEVQDTGIGIAVEDLPRVFDRFHQVRGDSAALNQGVGIGLALAKEIVEHHEGRLEVESEPGKGSTFRIRLPRAEPTEDTPREEPASAAPAVEEPFEKAFRSADRSWRKPAEVKEDRLPVVGTGDRVVLVADDEPDMRAYIVSLLATDYRVVQTPHGGNVSALVAEHGPDLVLLDWMMPEKNGLEVCRDLRANPALNDLKIMMLTARIDEKSKLDALQTGADDFLTKPFSSIEVKTRVANLLQNARLQKDLRGRNEELTATIGKLQQTETLLIQSEKMNAIGSLSAGLLHEINNPLNYTLTAISLARRDEAVLNDGMREILADVEEGMLRIRDVITHLKNFAYPEKPGTESRFSFAEVFLAARKMVAGELEDLTVEADVPGHLMVQGQRTQLTHVVINLLGNAAKALTKNPPGKRRVITVNARAEDDRLVFSVADNGPGIAPEILNRIFEPFFTTREVGTGMGMGLSICHTILESHHGSITAANQAGGGAIFTIHLPLAQEVSLTGASQA